MQRPPNSTDAVLENLDWVRNLARALLKDEAAAEDLVQDTWLRVRSSTASRGAPPSGAAGRRWLGRVMRNLAMEQWRSGSRRQRRERAAARPEAAPTDAELDEASEVRQRLALWVSELPQPYRRVALLRWMEGMTAAEIAKGEDRPIATVRSQLARARSLLRERAKREERGGAAALLAVAAGFPRESFTAAAAATPIPLAGWILMKATVVVTVAAAAVAAFAVYWFHGGVDSPSVVAPVHDALASDEIVDLTPLATVEDQVGDRVRTVASNPGLADELVEEESESVAIAGALLVRVQDQAGRALGGVPVAVFRRGVGSSAVPLRARTEAATGLALMEDLQSRLSERGEEVTSSLFTVGLDVPGLDLKRVSIDPLSLPLDPVLLTMPDYGSLEVRVVDGNGAPITAHDWLNITPIFPSPSEPGRFRRGLRYSAQITGESRATFHHVQARTKLRVEVSDVGVLAGVHEHIEPLRAGEHRVVKLVVAETLPQMTGRVVLADGSPVSAHWLEAEFTPDGDGRAGLRADGTFAMPLDRISADPGESFSGVLSVRVHDASGDSASEKALSGRFDAVVPSSELPTHIGTIVLREPAVFAAGRVLSDDGEPIEGAWVSLYEKFNRREDPEDFGWNYAGIDYAYTNAEGQFTVNVDRPPGEYAIRAHGEGHIDRGALRFQAGSEDMVLVLDQERHLKGRLLVPKGVDPSLLRLVAQVPGATREERAYSDFQGLVNANAEFRLAGLRPAAVTLTLHHGTSEETLAQQEGVVPSLQSDTVTDGISPWDVREQIAHVAFSVVLADGSPAPRALIAYGGKALPFQRGRVDSLVARSESDEVVVIAPGHRPTNLSIRSLPDEVKLVRGVPVRVAIGAALPAAPEGARVVLALEAEKPEWLPGKAGARGEMPEFRYRRTLWTEELPVLPGETEWTVYVSGTGTYRPVWYVRHPSEDVVLRGFRKRSFYTESSRYEIVVESSSSTATRWLVQPSLKQALEAMQPDD
jgi:RNA polymerase sigma factor (sigma-70 family)